MAKRLPVGWKAHGSNCWVYRENAWGFHAESVLRFVDHGCIRFEAHYCDASISEFAGYRHLALPSKAKRFENREDAFRFCEAMYKKRIELETLLADEKRSRM